MAEKTRSLLRTVQQSLVVLLLVLLCSSSIASSHETERQDVETHAGVLVAANDGPDGKYCGSFSVGLIKGVLSVRQPQHRFDIHVEGMGQNMTCMDEAYAYDEKTERLEVPGAVDKEDCLGKVLDSGKLQLDVMYFPAEDQIRLDLGFTFIDCKKCE